ncbi:MAG: CBS domain-containing protein, partial [Oscillospiraceae bacterium]|nr:CBS domain-containing protein [Oscillospiraceae bacterium]
SAVVSITPEESAALAARLLSRHDLGALPVCRQDGTLMGIVTDRDIITRCVAAGEEPSRVPVQDIMSRQPITVGPGDDVRAAARQMGAAQIRRLPVVEDGAVVGMVSLGDLARSKRCDTEAAATLADISARLRTSRRK